LLLVLTLIEILVFILQPYTSRLRDHFVVWDHYPLTVTQSNLEYATITKSVINQWNKELGFTALKLIPHEDYDWTTEVIPNLPDIEIQIYENAVDLPSPKYNVRNQSFYGSTTCYGDVGQMCSISLYNNTSENLALYLKHNIGHTLGLAHDSDKSSIMYGGVLTKDNNSVVTSRDIEAIRKLFLSSEQNKIK
jgi:predicted Zn-dependent protease